MKEIDFKFDTIKIGHAQDKEAGTGLTVILSEEGMGAGVDVAGGGPASRETTLLDPVAAADKIHAVVLSGGSAFGLSAASGVMEYLEERGYGFETGFRKVPLVVQSDLYDLGVADPKAFPDAGMAYAACENADENFKNNWIIEQGSVGAGTGATVGKLLGPAQMMKSGIGTYAAQVGDLKMGCIIAVNALGDVRDSSGEILAGLLSEDGSSFLNTEAVMFSEEYNPGDPFDVSNTTIGCLITNGIFDKAQLTKIAQMGQDGIARAIAPIHTTADGDTLYCVTENLVEADLNLAGTLAAYVCARAIENAVKNAESLYGLKTYADFKN